MSNAGYHQRGKPRLSHEVMVAIHTMHLSGDPVCLIASSYGISDSCVRAMIDGETRGSESAREQAERTVLRSIDVESREHSWYAQYKRAAT